jgi:hypothetical protein
MVAVRTLMVIGLALSACSTTNNTTIIAPDDDAGTRDGRLIGTWKSDHTQLTFRADGSLLFEGMGGGTGCSDHTLTDGVWDNEDHTTVLVGVTHQQVETTGCPDPADNIPLHDNPSFNPNVFAVSYVISGDTLIASFPNPAAIYTRQ